MGGDGVCRSLYMCMRVRAYCILQTLRTLHVVERWAVIVSAAVYVCVCVYVCTKCVYMYTLALNVCICIHLRAASDCTHATHCPYIHTHTLYTRTVCTYILYIYTHSIYTCTQVCTGYRWRIWVNIISHRRWQQLDIVGQWLRLLQCLNTCGCVYVHTVFFRLFAH